MNKKYNPKEIEADLYQRWEQAGYFQPAAEGAPYCILIPPPNITGSLHMGHGFQHTLIDTLIRYQRMQGHSALWQMGTDHAGIATQMLVERQLEAEGITRQSLGREAFTDKIWQWYDQSGDGICHQVRRMGSSVDWGRARFTMDAGYSEAVVKAFVELHREGLIYRGKRLVNWDPVLATAISDLEVENHEEQGYMWYLRYPLVKGAKTLDGKGYLVVATTRPETMLGDSAVAVHPEDARYQHLIGKQVQLPLTERILPIIADDYVDPALGTGCLKITPAHDFNDHEVGQRHNLPSINVLTAQATINSNAPEIWQGLDRFVAREQIIQTLKEQGLLEKTDSHEISIPRGDRSGAIIEPRLTDQWFVKMAPLAAPAMQAIQDGRIRFVPKNYENLYFSWLRDIQDWCISRQQWWGHRIPAWYDPDGHVYVGLDEQDARQAHGLADSLPLRQEEDVLETWFSSGLWSFASLGWPEQTEALARYHPTSVLVTGHDIIFFWVARMIMLSLKLYKSLPFREVYVHGLVRDAQGRKMSKTQGNGLDPLDLIDGIDLDSLIAKRTANLMQPKMMERIERDTRKEFPQGIPVFGTDALRFTFCAIAVRGRDIPFDIQRIAGYQHFCNKLWNAANFVFANTEGHDCGYPDRGELELSLADRWILQCWQVQLDALHKAMRTYRFDVMARLLYEFVWHEYCDWYLELVKPTLFDSASSAQRRQSIRNRLLMILESAVRGLHPIIPFITEALWQRCAKLMSLPGDTIMLQHYPAAADYQDQPTGDAADTTLADMQWLKNVVTGVRTIRSELNVPPKQQVDLILQGGDQRDIELAAQNDVYLKKLAKIHRIHWLQDDGSTPRAAVQLVGKLKLLVPLTDADKETEIARLRKEIKKCEEALLRLRKQLDNKSFISKAPAEVVAGKKQKEAELQSALAKLHTQNKALAAC